MSLFLTGDLHGNITRFRMAGLGAGDTVIVLGDFGVPWADKEDVLADRPKLEELDHRGCDIAFIDGNHENFKRLEAMPSAERYGGIVGKVSEHVFHLRRGQVYEVGGRSFFCMGGATTVDKAYFEANKEWWPQEAITDAQMQTGLENLARRGNAVDCILTHTPPLSVLQKIVSGSMNNVVKNDPSAEKLEVLRTSIAYKYWFFGHMHMDGRVRDEPKFVALFRSIIDLDKPSELKKLPWLPRMGR